MGVGLGVGAGGCGFIKGGHCWCVLVINSGKGIDGVKSTMGERGRWREEMRG